MSPGLIPAYELAPDYAAHQAADAAKRAKFRPGIRVAPPTEDPGEGTVRCAACDWCWSGPFVEGAARHLEHRRANHPELRTSSSRRRGVGRHPSKSPRREYGAEKVPQMLAELRRAPRTAAELAPLVGTTTIQAATLLSWAKRQGEPLAKDGERRWFIPGVTPPPDVG